MAGATEPGERRGRAAPTEPGEGRGRAAPTEPDRDEIETVGESRRRGGAEERDGRSGLPPSAGESSGDPALGMAGRTGPHPLSFASVGACRVLEPTSEAPPGDSSTNE